MKVATFEDDEAIRHGVLVAMVDILANEFHEVRQGHYGTGYNEIELPLLFLCSFLEAFYVG